MNEQIEITEGCYPSLSMGGTVDPHRDRYVPYTPHIKDGATSHHNTESPTNP